MMDPNYIQALLRRSGSEQWSYPKLFDALKHGGVEYYVADVDRQRIVYYGGKSLYEQRLASGGDMLSIAPEFNKDALLQAITRNQRKESTYVEFLKEIAAAGIGRYRVDMHDRTVTYSHTPTEIHVEPVPPYKPEE
jgi:uncharacterized protein YbcV (DUF1398 family)